MEVVKFRGFGSIEEIKARAEYIRKGQIYPSRILKAEPRKLQSRVKSGSHQYAIPTKSGYLIYVDNKNEFDCVARVTASSGVFTGSPYIVGGETKWQGDHDLTESEFLSIFNRGYLSMNGVNNG